MSKRKPDAWRVELNGKPVPGTLAGRRGEAVHFRRLEAMCDIGAYDSHRVVDREAKRLGYRVVPVRVVPMERDDA